MRKIIVLIGRSGCGKSTIADRLIDSKYNYKTVQTATTRNRRDGESEDAYHFMSADEFVDRINNDEFVEWDVYNDNCYGTLKSELQTNEKLVLVLTPKGAEAIKKAFPEAFIVYVETDLKTSVMRAITREKSLSPSKLKTISTRACTDEYVFDNPVCDSILSNPEGAKFEDLVNMLVNAHEKWISDQELLELL